MVWKRKDMDHIIIEKVINNNIISAYEKSGAEVIVMGRGIGFKKKQGEVVPADQISKIFRIKSRTLTEQFKELLANMPLERVRISDEIISHAKDHLKLKLNQSIYVTLTDHINFAIERVSQGIEPQNALLWEIKRFYPQVLLGLCVHFFFYSIVSQKKILEVKNDSIIKQYDELSDSIHKYKCIIHDQKYFFNYVEEMLKDRQSEEIQNTLANYQKCFGERYYWTGIEFIDNVITIEKRKMDAYQIEFQVEFSIDDIYIEPMDLVIIMENLLENAIEAASKCELKRKIVFELKNINDVLLLKIWNTSCKFPYVKKDRFITDKDDSNVHGWGVESVKSIVNKYNGSIEFKYDETFFEVDIII